MPTPSLLIVPARFKTGKLYSQIPTSGAGDFTVTRNTAARRFDSAGLIASVASGIPRLDYYTSGGVTGCPALLVEPAATNLAFRSNELSTIPNVVDASTTTGTPFISPDGTANAMRFTETTVNDRHGFYQYVILANGVHTVSVFTKQTGRRYIAFTSDYTGTGTSTYFDLQTATTVSVGSGWTARIEPYADGWYRLSCTATAVAGSRYAIWGGSVSGTSNSYIGSTSISNTFYGLQIETGSVATSYIPTTTGSASRSADIISVTGAVSGSIGQTEGTIYLEVDAANANSQFFRINIGVSNAIHIYKNASDRYQVRIYSSASSIDLTDTSAKSGFVKIAIAYKSGESALVINGGSPITSATAYSFSAALNTINFLGGVEPARPARIRAVALYTTRLSNAELATLTTL